MPKSTVTQQRARYLFGCVAMALMATQPALAEIKGYVDGVIYDGNGAAYLKGWACEVNNASPIVVTAYAGGTWTSQASPLVAYKATNSSTNKPSEDTINQLCGFNDSVQRNYRFETPIDTFLPEALYVYGEAGTAALLGNSGLYSIPLRKEATSLTTPLPAGAEQQGWNADNINYFTLWNCQSDSIHTITRLNILASEKLGKKERGFLHLHEQWKDSLVAGSDSAGNLTLYFTFGDASLNGLLAANQRGVSLFSMLMAKYNANKSRWDTYQYLVDSKGVSSHAGTDIDYIYNKYQEPGWGPFAKTSSTAPKILGVDGNGKLVGNGLLGLSNIRDPIQPYDNNYDTNTHTCLVMNPSLFDYDSTGHPKAFIATLWTEEWTSATSRQMVGCLLDANTPGTTPFTVAGTTYGLLPPGAYVFRYHADGTGWQLDTSGRLEDQGLFEAMNADPVVASPETFVRADWSAKIMEISSSKPAKTILNCASASTANTYGLHFAEASRGPNQAYYFLADQNQANDPNTLKIEHDIFVAY